jgi:hypothetical protein
MAIRSSFIRRRALRLADLSSNVRKLGPSVRAIEDHGVQRLACVLAIAIASACTAPSATDDAAEVARELCKCLDVDDPTCQATGEAAIGTPSTACIECVFANTNACAAMEAQCEPLCIPETDTGDR